jgi:hypothetical protein
VTELGIVIEFNAEPWNALAPIFVTTFPILTPIKFAVEGTILDGIEVIVAI